MLMTANFIFEDNLLKHDIGNLQSNLKILLEWFKCNQMMTKSGIIITNSVYVT